MSVQPVIPVLNQLSDNKSPGNIGPGSTAAESTGQAPGASSANAGGPTVIEEYETIVVDEEYLETYVSNMTKEEMDEVFMVWIDWQYGFVGPKNYNNDPNAPIYQSLQIVPGSRRNNFIAFRLGTQTPTVTLSSFLAASWETSYGTATPVTPPTEQWGQETTTGAGSVKMNQPISNSEKDPTKNKLAKYRTLNYASIVSRSDKKDKGENLEDFRSDTSITPAADQGLKASNGKIIVLDTAPVTVGNRLKPQDFGDDFIVIKIGGLVFRSFLTSLSDSYSINWNDINYIGRQDTYKAFKGTTRNGSIAFKVPAFRAEEMETVYKNLNSLVETVGVADDKGNYLKGPATTLTIGDWWRGVLVAVSSLKYDIQTSDYAWDLDVALPQIVDVSMDFTVLDFKTDISVPKVKLDKAIARYGKDQNFKGYDGLGYNYV